MRPALLILGVVTAFYFIGARDNTAVFATPVHVADERAADSRVDFYGNEISPAVADYRTDSLGTLYESHTPDTAVLSVSELAPPGT